MEVGGGGTVVATDLAGAVSVVKTGAEVENCANSCFLHSRAGWRAKFTDVKRHWSGFRS